MRTFSKIKLSTTAACLMMVAAGLLMCVYYFVRPSPVLGLLWRLFLGAGSSVLILLIASRSRLSLPSPTLIVAASGALAALLAFVALENFPSSADADGYTYVADTLLQGRLCNALPPAPDILTMQYIVARDGKLVSQYPPGWPALLAPFRAAGVEWFVNPLLTLALGFG